jgi:hypothetical protein
MKGESCDGSSKVAYGIQCRHDSAINGVFNFEKIRDPERWKLRLLELSSDTWSFVSLPIDSNGSNAEFMMTTMMGGLVDTQSLMMMMTMILIT